MECEQATPLISARVDRELRGPDRELLDLHLRACFACNALAEELAAQDRLLRDTYAPLTARADALAARARAELQARGARKPTLLVVDDEPYILPTLKALLAPQFDVLTADSADAAQALLLQRPVDLVLTDQKMPRRTGVQLLEWVRAHRPQAVRLLMTGYAELDDAVDAINRGHVYHYLLKPWRTQELLQVLRNAADKRALEAGRDRLLAELRRLNAELERRVGQRTAELERANGLLQQRTRELERMALTDPLTGLLNRRAMDELARFELKRHARYPSPLALGFVDVDHFKAVNTRHLLTGGDAVLAWLGRALAATVREVDSVGRVGGEEFLVLARETGEEGARALAERLRATVAAGAAEHGGARIGVTVSVGFAVAEVGSPAGYGAMVEAAAGALAEAKAAGRNRCVVRTMPRSSEDTAS